MRKGRDSVKIKYELKSKDKSAMYGILHTNYGSY